MTTMMTISDIATKLGVTRATAYGLVHLFEKKGMISPVSKKVTGSKGKPASLYTFTDSHVQAAADLVRSLVPTETPAETAPAQEQATETAVAAF